MTPRSRFPKEDYRQRKTARKGLPGTSKADRKNVFAWKEGRVGGTRRRAAAGGWQRRPSGAPTFRRSRAYRKITFSVALPFLTSLPVVLHLERPLVFFDLEATGTDPQEARIIQVGLQRFVPAGDGAALDETLDALVDPECKIPASVAQLTGLDPASVRNAPPFRAHRDRLASLLADADLAGYNALAYDLPLLRAEFDRCGRSLPGPADRVVLDPYRLEQVLRPRTLSALYERYTGAALDGAHDALRDVEATGRVLQAQLSEHDLAGTPADLADHIRGDYLDDQRRLKRDGGAVVVCFGKHEGKTLQELRTHHGDYFDWMYRTIDDLRPHIDDALS